MIDKNFKEGFKNSYDKTYTARLFRLPDANGEIRLSLEVMMHMGGYVFYQLPKEYWLDTTEIIDWDTNQNILFFTTNSRTHAFIYDITHLTMVHESFVPGSDIRWNDDERRWEVKIYYTITHNGEQQHGVLNKILALPYAEETPQPPYKVIPTPNSRYALVLTKMKKKFKIEPVKWEMGLVDLNSYTWAVENLPYQIMGDDSIRFYEQYVRSYGLSKNYSSCYILNFNLNDIQKYGNLPVHIHDFSPIRPERVIWEEKSKFWSAVIKGEVIHPRPFYFDNLYTDDFPIQNKALPVHILELLPQTEELDRLIATRKEEENRHKQAPAQQQKQSVETHKPAETYRQNNDSATKISPHAEAVLNKEKKILKLKIILYVIASLLFIAYIIYVYISNNK